MSRWLAQQTHDGAHVLPLHDLIRHTESDDCACGPTSGHVVSERHDAHVRSMSMRVNYAYRCYICAVMPEWSLERLGDAACTWACGAHLQTAMREMQRPWEVSEIRVHPFQRRTKVYKRDDGKWISVCLRCTPRVWAELDTWTDALAVASLHASMWHAKEPQSAT